MKFEEINYKRPEIESVKKEFNTLLKQVESSQTPEEQVEQIEKINELRSEFDTAQSIAHVRFTQDTTNESYREEYNYFNENAPAYEGLENEFRSLLLKSPFRSELEGHFGKHIFRLYESQINTHKQEIEEDLKKENQLVNEYITLMSSAKIPFRGETYNLTGLAKFTNDTDRETRKEASKAKFKWFSENGEKLDEIYDKLVKTRHQIATGLGYETFTPLAYARMSRTDWGPEEAEKFRDSIHKLIVPLATKLRKKQAKWLKLDDDLKYYDEALKFPTGNPTPKGDHKWVQERAKEMYSELSPETDEFFDFLMENNLMDLENRTGKAGGGYCTYIFKHKYPFIFANFNGTAHDVKVLTHEVGHAFQFYCSRNVVMPEYLAPTMEGAEIHSMSMEFLTLPWMGKFFKDEEEKFHYSLLSDRLLFLPYGVAVDEFQHYVYQNPHASPEMRKKKWREIEEKYLPHRKYDGEKFLEDGGFWQQQRHIFVNPFYYIDYTLADICAMQLWVRSRKNPGKAFDDYIELCKAGGTKPFTELLEQANLKSPFGEEAIKEVTNEVEKWLNSMDEEKAKM